MYSCENHDCLRPDRCSQNETIAYPRGIKWTRQRKDVYAVLYSAKEPLSAVQIYQQVAKSEDSCNYAVSTIYRILTAFEAKNLVNKTNWVGDGTVVYELNRGGHTHYAVCMNCNKRIPLQVCPFEHIHLQDEAAEQGLEDAGFQIIGHKLELYGYCRECKSAIK